MTLRRGVTVAAITIVLGAVVACGSENEAATDTASSTTSTSIVTPPSTSTTPPTTSATTTSAAAPSTTGAPMTTTTTIAPIVTYSADIGILAPVAVAAPVRVTIPTLGVDGTVAPVGVNEADQLDVPADARTLVWYQFGPTPGAPGSAVIAGHLNWKGVEGIFSELASTPVGAEFSVTYDDGSSRAFVVRSVDLVDKPAVAVNGTFARDGESVLRLVTCGGEFDRSVSSYRSNVIVTAVPA